MSYCGKILRISLKDKKSEAVRLDESDLKGYIGGVGLAAKLHYQMRTFEADPLSDKNVLTIMTGPLTATRIPATSRAEFCARSPLTGIWV